MKNKFKCILGCLLVFSSTLAEQKNPFDDLFKDFNFDQFLSDMEKEIGKDQDTKKSTPPTKSDATTPTTQDLSDQSFGKTKEELFLHPIMKQNSEKGKTAKATLTKKSRQAFKDVMEELVSLVNELETKAMGMRQFSTPFKEALSQYLDVFDKINVATQRILSKKLYSTIMPFEQSKKQEKDEAKPPKKDSASKQPKDAATLLSLRQDILKVIQDLKKLIAQIKYDPTTEETETGNLEQLQELQKLPHHKIDFGKPLMKANKKRRHHTPDDELSDSNTKPEIKNDLTTKPQDTSVPSPDEEIPS
jgi:hypothetical protein